MKVKVNRRLSGGKYHVNFEVGQFSPEEIRKMESFGVPTIKMEFSNSQGTFGSVRPINQINSLPPASYDSEEEAKSYEADVISQLRIAVQRLRESQDKYTSSEEVAL
jgi:hypothetical protein